LSSLENLKHNVFEADVNEISRELFVGEIVNNKIKVKNDKNDTLYLDVSVSEQIKEMVNLRTKTLAIPSGQEGLVDFDIKVPLNYSRGLYNGYIKLKSKTGTETTTIPLQIRVTETSSMQPSIRIKLAKVSFVPGDKFKMTVFFTNIVDIHQDIILTSKIKDLKSDRIVMINELTVYNNMSSIDVELDISKNISLGEYVASSTLSYREYSGKINEFSDSESFSIVKPFLERTYFFLPNWLYLIILIASVFLGFLVSKSMKFIESRRRFHLEVDQSQLPQPGDRTAFVGYLAERNVRTFFEVDKLTTHALIAGSTGGGKSVSAQVIVEEALQKGVCVIVFDPTAQWSGFLRKNADKQMLGLYAKYGMTIKEAHGYSGNVHQVTNSRQLIKIKEIIKPGEITVFALNKMDLKEIDTFVANTVRQVFKDNFDECRELRLLLVYDEVHRLLPKFGGNGIGFMQIERACREFRKWGVGLMLISQVLTDFAGQIKANINTEIQMRTREETDLERLKTKYGEELLHAVVKAPVGTGMLQNSAYNRGRPYMIAFRPLLHSTERLGDEELLKYNEYNAKIDDLFYELDQLEKLNIDVFDLKLELKLASDKVATGAFNLVDIYLETLVPRIKSSWEQTGKQPLKREVQLVPQSEIDEDIRLAKFANQKAASAQSVINGAQIVEQPISVISSKEDSVKQNAPSKEPAKPKAPKYAAVIIDSEDSDILYHNIEKVVESLENDGKDVSLIKLKLTSLKSSLSEKETLIKLKQIKGELES
jgi:DNA helicase HerA-like ATPase